jgi:hypothetical protein
LTDALTASQIVEIDNYLTAFLPTNALRTITTFTATAGQTTFSVTYTQGLIDVYYNGSCLAQSEYTAINGTSIILATACQVNDIVVVYAYNYSVGAYSGIGGSGTTNYVSKFTGTNTIGNSIISDNGTTASVLGKLLVSSAGNAPSFIWSGINDLVVTNNLFASQAVITNNNTSGNYSILSIGKSRGTLASPTAVVNGEVIGSTIFFGHDGTNYLQGAEIITTIDNTVSTGIVPTSLSIKTRDSSGNFADRVKVSSSGSTTFTSGIGIGNATATTGGIQFPATQTTISDSNNLDDYEEGTWTPTFGGSGSNPTSVTYDGRSGSYTKVGRVVTISFFMGFTTYSGGGGAVTVSGLPFPCISAFTFNGACQLEQFTFLSGRTYAAIRVLPGSTELDAQQMGSATTWTSFAIGTAVTSSGTGKYIQGTVTYFTN